MTKRPLIVSSTGLSPSLAGLPMPFPYHEPSFAPAATSASHAPLPSVRNACRLTRTQFGLFPVRSPLLRESLLFSLPRGTEMFQFPRCPPDSLCIQPPVSSHYGRGVPPFGYPRIHACVRLPKAFRCSPRPSSAPGAKASPVRPSYLILLGCRSALHRGVTSVARSVTYPKRTLPLSFPSVPCDPGVSLPLAPSDVRRWTASALDTWTTSMLSLGIHSVTYKYVRSLIHTLRFLALLAPRWRQRLPAPSSIPCDAGVLLVGQDPGPALLATCAAFPARPVLLS